MIINFFKRSEFLGAAILMAMALTGCDNQIYDYLEPCQTNYHLKFRYVYHMKNGDAFPSEVNSVAVWAFDQNGNLAWQHSESVDSLAAEDYSVNISLPDGKYDFVTWCGLSDDMPFHLDKMNPESISDLGINLVLSSPTKADADMVSSTPFTGLYHDIKRGVEITSNPNVESDNEIGFSLTKDTNYFKILLQNIDGTQMNEDDFSFRITDGNNRLEHDNSVGNGVKFDYVPSDVTSTLANVKDDTLAEGSITALSGILAEMHTSRLMENGKYKLIIRRNSDNTDIITIPLVEFLLLVKGKYHKMTDQEYLDRQDEFNLTFFIDKNNNWYQSAGIYVNAWHIVPPQDENMSW